MGRDDRVAFWSRAPLTLGWCALLVAIAEAALDRLGSAWTPVVDDALIAALTVDTFSSDPPLVGMPTSLGLQDGVPLSHAGPLEFWLLSIPTVLAGEPGKGLVVGATVLSLASLVGIAVLLRRRTWPVEAIGLVLVAGMVGSLGAPIFSSPFNPYVGILPLVLSLLATWGVVAGRVEQLWVLVLAGSLAGQTHLGFLPVVGILVLLAVAGVVVEARRADPTRRAWIIRRPVALAVVLGVVAWIGPILDQFFGNGNLGRLIANQGEGREVSGFDHAGSILVEMTAVPPLWLTEQIGTRSVADPGAGRIAVAAASILVLVGLGAVAARRRDRPLAAAVVVSLGATAGATLASARITQVDTGVFFDPERAPLYRFGWWPVGVLHLLVLVWGIGRLLAPWLRERRPGLLSARSWVAPAAIGTVGAVVVVFLLMSNARPPVQGFDTFFEQQVLTAEAVTRELDDPSAVVLRIEAVDGAVAPPPGVWNLGPYSLYGHAANLIAQLRLRGVDVRFPDSGPDEVVFMRSYRIDNPPSGGETELLFRVGPGAGDDPPDGHRLVAQTGDGGPFTPVTAVFAAR